MRFGQLAFCEAILVRLLIRGQLIGKRVLGMIVSKLSLLASQEWTCMGWRRLVLLSKNLQRERIEAKNRVVDILMGSWTSSLPSALSKKTIYVGTANFVGRCENPECRNITEYGGISRNMAEYHGICRNITEYGGISRNITTFSRNIPEHHDIFRW